MPTPRHGRAPAAGRRVGRITSLLAGAVAAALAAFLATAPVAGASTTARPAEPAAEAADTGPGAYSPALRRLAIRALADKLGISDVEAAARLDELASRTRAATALQSALGSRVAGTYLSRSTGELVVNVTDADAAARVQAAGATPRYVSRSMAQLRRVQTQMDAAGGIPGTSWAIDAASNTVTVQVSETAAADGRADAWMRRLARYGDAVRVQRTATTFSTHAFFGGQAILNAAGGGRCTSAFNATDGVRAFVITAGHCTEAVRTWTDGTQLIGQSDVVSFPGDDYGTIEVANPNALDPQPAVIDRGRAEPQPITGSAVVPVGSLVCKTGSTTGTTCGTVQAYNATVVYPEGTVRGLIRTDVCTQPGDSGGALFAGDQAQGIVSGGSTSGCGAFGFVSFFQPVNEALQETGLRLLQ